MRAKRTVSALTAAVFASVMLTTPALAAKFEGNPVLTYTMEDGGIALGVDGLDGKQNVYAAQVTLELNGKYPNAELIPNESYVEVQNRVAISDNKTQLTVYLDSQVPINEGKKLELGSLNFGDKTGMPSRADLVLLDMELDKTDFKVNVQNEADGAGGGSGDHSSGGGSQSQENSNNSSSNSSTSKAEAKIKKTGKGTVKVDPVKAAAGDKVTITATPDKGYQVARVVVTDRDKEEVKVKELADNQFTFVQPKHAPVTITVEFEEEKEEQKPAPEMPFTDIQKTDWYFDAVGYVYQKGLMSGTFATTFGPNITTTRGMIVTILHRMEGTPAAAGASFQDVQTGKYYANAVAWAAANGIVTGYGNSTFGPNDTITREQLASILYRYASYKKYDVSKRVNLGTFADAGKIHSYATESMSWANASGLISGVGNAMLSPETGATRAQVAAILMRFCENIAK